MNTDNPITKTIITTHAIVYQLIGFGILFLLIVGDEVFDIPHSVFGFPATPINWSEAVIEGSYIIVLCAFTIYLSFRFLKEIKFLEGFLPICSFCKKIRKGNDWVQLEQYMSDHSEVIFSHGLCPECLEKNYGSIMNDIKRKSSSENK